MSLLDQTPTKTRQSVPSRGRSRHTDNTWKEENPCDHNATSLSRGPTDIEVVPCHCFPGEMCYDACSIRKNLPVITPRQCTKRMQAAANGYSAHGVSTTKFPGVKVLVGRNGLPVIVNPSFAFPSPRHIDAFLGREPSMLSLGGQDSSVSPSPTPKSSSFPKSNPPILSLLSTRDCSSSAPTICCAEGDNGTQCPSSTSITVDSNGISSSNSTIAKKLVLAPRTVSEGEAQKNKSTVNHTDIPYANTLQAEFNELVIKLNIDEDTKLSKHIQNHNDNPTDSHPYRCHVSPPDDNSHTITKVTSLSSPSSDPMSFLSVPTLASPTSLVPSSTSSNTSLSTVTDATSDANTSPSFTSTSAEGLTVFTPSSAPPLTNTPISEVSTINPTDTPTNTFALPVIMISQPSPTRPSPIAFSPTFSCRRPSSSRSHFSFRTSCPSSSASSVSSGSVSSHTVANPGSPSAFTSCPTLPKAIAANQPATTSHSVPPRTRATPVSKPIVQPILEHSPLVTATNGAPKQRGSSSKLVINAISSKKSPSPTPVSTHRCQVLNLTDAIRQLHGDLFEDEGPLEVYQDYYDWIEGRG